MSCGQNAHIYYGNSDTGRVTVVVDGKPNCGVVVDNSQGLEFIRSHSKNNVKYGFHLTNNASVKFRASSASDNDKPSGNYIDLKVDPGSSYTADSRSNMGNVA